MVTDPGCSVGQIGRVCVGGFMVDPGRSQCSGGFAVEFGNGRSWGRWEEVVAVRGGGGGGRDREWVGAAVSMMVLHRSPALLHDGIHGCSSVSTLVGKGWGWGWGWS